MKRVENLLLPTGREPFTDWLDTLDLQIQAKVMNFVRRVAAGGAKNNLKALGEGVFEVRIDSGPGYRIYFGEIRKEVLYLLIGGNKKTQDRDIAKAKEYWRLYVPKQFF